MDRPERKWPALARAEARLRLRVRSAAVLLPALGMLAGALATGAPAASAAGTGSVAGLVEDAAAKTPVAGIAVCARATSEPFAQECTTSDAKGDYLIAGLAGGQYHVSFSASAESGLNYLTQYFKGQSTEALAEPVSVTEGATTHEVSAALQPGGEIEGTVTEGENTPLAGGKVCALEKGTETARCVVTNATGGYTIAGLASGEYEVEFAAPPGFVTQFYENATSRAQAKAVPVTAGAAAVKGVSAVLQPEAPPPGTIAGTVSSAITGLPLAGVKVCALGVGGAGETCVSTDASGAYALPGLAPGEYHVEFVPPEEGEAYELQWYAEKSGEAEAAAVTVASGATTGEIDAKLVPAEAGPAPSAPVSLAKPTISGTTQQGQALAFTPGTWQFEPTLITDEWGRCASSGVIETCHTIATTSTYTLTAEDVGSTIRIREKAFNAWGEGQAFSRPTGVIGAPLASPQATSAAASPAPAPTAGVSSQIANVASAAQLKALLAKLLVPRGKAAKLASLHARGSYTIAFASLAASRISVAWYFVPKGAHLSAAKRKPKPLLVASGKLTTREAGTAKLTIRLTAAGRSLLAKGKPLKLTAKGALAPKGRPTLNATRSFTLSR